MIIGPSAPNGPPEPIEIAEEIGFEKSDFRFYPATIQQNGLDRLRYAVASDALGAVFRHDSDDQCASDGNKNAVYPEMVACRRNHRCAPPAKIEKIGE